jgi:2-(1,2-epoxy-1,2-dihydrophenyl)acetyl-CoA isomerase
MQNEECLRIERPEPGIATLTQCRRGGPNVISVAFCERLLHCTEILADDDGLGAVVLRAEGPTFCVGADIHSLHEHLDDLPAQVASLIDSAHAAVLAMRRLQVPVIASVAGAAAGGGFSLALACDRIMAGRSARFVVAYPQLGTTPDMGMSHALAALLGPRRALDLVLARSPLGADDAHRLGLVSGVCDDRALDNAALAVARQWVGLPPAAVRGAKALFTADDIDAMERQMEREKASFVRCAAPAEFRRRVIAFLERTPR